MVETRDFSVMVENEHAKMNVKISFEYSETNSKGVIVELFSLKKLVKTYNNQVMPEVKNYPVSLIEEDLKNNLNETCNLNITKVEINDLKIKETEIEK